MRIQTILTHPGTAVILRLVLGSVFLYAGGEKIGDPDAFAKDIYNYRILPLSAVNAVAIVLPWVEIICGLLLLAGVWTGGSSLLVTLMLLVFLLALASALVRGLDIRCGCFSSSSNEPISVWYLVRDSALLLFSLQIFLFDQKAFSLGRGRRLSSRS